MIHFAYEETIAASPEAVFKVMADISRFDEWLAMDGRPAATGPTHLGSRFESTGKLGPMTVHGTGEVTRFEPDRGFGFRLVVPNAIDFVLDIELAEDAAGTRLSGSGSMTTHRLWRLLEPVMRGEVQAGEVREAKRLKELVEAAS